MLKLKVFFSDALVCALTGKGMSAGESFLQLQAIASQPVQHNYFNVQRYAQLPTLSEHVSAAMCNGEASTLSDTTQLYNQPIVTFS